MDSNSDNRKATAEAPKEYICHGFYWDKVSYGRKLCNIRALYDNEPAVDSNQRPLWCVEKQRVLPASIKLSPRSFGGTIRSPECNHVTYEKDNMSLQCKKIPRNDVLRK